MNEIFDAALEYILRDEGSKYTNDPRDSGGPTKFGVTLKAYEDFKGQPVTPEDIQNLTLEIIKPFYFENYWTPLKCDLITQKATAIAIFDTGILYGVNQTSFMVQLAVNRCGGFLKLDSVLGDKSVAALNTTKEDDFLNAFHLSIATRINTVIANNPKNEVYRKGWTNRADRLLTLIT